jgi:hypothetical protein
MPRLIIKGTPINLPDSGQAPNWAPAVIEAFEALTEAVNAVSGSFDVPPQVQNIDSNNISSNIDMNNLIFPPGEVRAATVYYSVYRKTEDNIPGDGEELVEAGTLELSYNNSRPINQKWELVRISQGDAKIAFNITDLGQVRFSTTSLTGNTSTHTGILSYRAISILNV